MNLKLATLLLLTSVLLVLMSGCGSSDQTADIPTKLPSATQPLQPMRFSASDDYQTFTSSLSSSFEDAVNSDFTAIEEKAGISIAVYTDDKLWTYATGEANVGVPITTGTPLFISSMSKTFLSAIILKQIEDGLYKKTDSLEAALSNHPDYQSFDPNKINPQVTIQELLTM